MRQARRVLSAEMVDFYTVAFRLSAKVRPATMKRVKLFDGEREVAAVLTPGEKGDTDRGFFTTVQKLDLTAGYYVKLDGFGAKDVIPTKIFDCPEFVQKYVYSGNDLGAVLGENSTTFKVWAPTASSVILNLFAAGDTVPAYAHIPMTKGERGVWETIQPCGHGTYYNYTVTTAVGTQDAADIYAKSAGVNGDRSMVIDLSKTNPSGWAETRRMQPKRYSDVILWEVHVRDFSNRIAASRYPGKYLAFTEQGLRNEAGIPVGVDYLKDLGVTHIHLLPIADYAKVVEAHPERSFNWGYDPKNYNVPEGSYSTDPFHGEVRVEELKRLVCALHDANLGVVMDVVYNHTYEGNSSFNKIVPYYYYRFEPDGTYQNATGCGNDTASERLMYRKFMVDSVSYWVREYKLDGLRFDLMGLHDLKTMELIEQAVHCVNPHAIIYGEGWDMGATLDGSPRAIQGNIGKISPTNGAAGAISVFNDAIRDGLKGSTFDLHSRGYISGSYGETEKQVQFGIMGGTGNCAAGWQVPGAAVINYMSAHDNNTLWDKLALSNPEDTVQQRMAMNRLGAAIVMISKGTPFWQAGEEMLRSKGGDENSYASGDAVNNLRWEDLQPGSGPYEMMCYYRGLIAMRKAYPVFTSPDSAVSFRELPGGGMAVKLDDGAGSQALAVIHPTQDPDHFLLKRQWHLVADVTRAGSQGLDTREGAVEVPPCSILIFVN